MVPNQKTNTLVSHFWIMKKETEDRGTLRSSSGLVIVTCLVMVKFGKYHNYLEGTQSDLIL